MNDRAVAIVARAIIDGQSVDWQRLAVGSTPRHMRLIADLRALAEFSGLRGAGVAPVSSELPWLLRTMAFLAGAIAVAGIVGMFAGSPLRPYHFVQLSIAVAFGGTGLLLAAGSRRAGAASLGGLYLCIAASFAVTGSRYLALTFSWTGVTNILDALCPEAFLGAYLWRFAEQFPARSHFRHIDRVAIFGFRLTMFIGSGLFCVNVLAASSRALGRWLTPFDRKTGAGDLFWLIVFATTLPALIVLALRARDALPGERRRVRLFLVAIVVGLAPIVSEVLAESVFPSFAAVMRAPRGRAIGALVLFPPLVAIAPITAYLVRVHDLMTLRAGVRRGLRHILKTWFTVSFILVGFASLATFVYARRADSVAVVLSATRARGLMLIIIAGSAAIVFRAALLRAADRWLVRDARDPAAVLTQLSGQLATCRTRVEIGRAFLRTCATALDTDGELHLAEPDGALVSVDGASVLPNDSLIPVLVRAGGTVYSVEPEGRDSYYTLLTGSDRRWVDASAFGTIVCLSSGSMSGQLLAVAFLRTPRTGGSFAADDARFLSAAATAAGFAVDARLSAPSARHASDELAQQCLHCFAVHGWRPDVRTCSCGGTLAMASLPKSLLGRYELERLLGAGGMGVVYLARDLQLDRRVAVKTLPSLSARAAERLMQEARAMAAMSHDRVAILFGIETWRDTPLLVMELLAGGTLSSLLRRAPLAAAAAVDLVLALAAALEYAHERGWYHGDIKPSNIALTESGIPKLLDFGLSRAIAVDRTASAGTLPYMSPEVLAGETADAAVDLWALCVVLFESATGVHPFLDGRRTAGRIRRGLDPAERTRYPQLDDSMWQFFVEALARSPQRRPRTATALSRRLRTLPIARIASDDA